MLEIVLANMAAWEAIVRTIAIILRLYPRGRRDVRCRLWFFAGCDRASRGQDCFERLEKAENAE